MNLHARKEFKGLVWTEAAIMKAAKLWADGHTTGHIAREFGVTRNSFCGIASRHRDLFPKKVGAIVIPQTRRGAEWTKEKVDQTLRMRLEGKTIKAISELVDMPLPSVAHIIRKHRSIFEDAPTVQGGASAEPSPPVQRRSFVGTRWVARVPYTTFAGAIVSLPHVSLINGPEA